MTDRQAQSEPFNNQTLQVIPQSTTGGSWCSSCGTYVPWGISHFCQLGAPFQPLLPQPNWWWPMTTVPSKTTFKGRVKDMHDLPRDAKVGEIYYVQEWNTLMTRVAEGWLLNMVEDED